MVVGADPEGSVLSGDIARPYLTEGVGEDFIPGTYDPASVDRWVRVSDRDAFVAARRITREEGILAGESCGTALVAALVVARELTCRGGGPTPSMVVLLPDGGRSYMSKLYNDEWMRVNGLLATTGAVVRVADLLADRHPPATGRRSSSPGRRARRRRHRDAPGVRDQPDAGVRGHRGRGGRRDRRVDLREGPARPGVPRSRPSWSGRSARSWMARCRSSTSSTSTMPSGCSRAAPARRS